MQNQVLHIKNMVCDRCIKSVTNILCDLAILHKPAKLLLIENNSVMIPYNTLKLPDSCF